MHVNAGRYRARVQPIELKNLRPATLKWAISADRMCEHNRISAPLTMRHKITLIHVAHNPPLEMNIFTCLGMHRGTVPRHEPGMATTQDHHVFDVAMSVCTCMSACAQSIDSRQPSITSQHGPPAASLCRLCCMCSQPWHHETRRSLPQTTGRSAVPVARSPSWRLSRLSFACPSHKKGENFEGVVTAQKRLFVSKMSFLLSFICCESE